MDVAAGEYRVPERDMRLNRTAVAVACGAVVLVAAVGALLFRTGRPGASPEQPIGWTPLPHRVQVEVMNSSKSAGAARIATLLLRHAGLDVVHAGNADAQFRGIERNRIVVRRGDTTGVGRVIEAIGGADVVDAPDPSRVVDLTVVLGATFAPPPDRVNSNH